MRYLEVMFTYFASLCFHNDISAAVVVVLLKVGVFGGEGQTEDTEGVVRAHDLNVHYNSLLMEPDKDSTDNNRVVH